MDEPDYATLLTRAEAYGTNDMGWTLIADLAWALRTALKVKASAEAANRILLHAREAPMPDPNAEPQSEAEELQAIKDMAKAIEQRMANVALAYGSEVHVSTTFIHCTGTSIPRIDIELRRKL